MSQDRDLVVIWITTSDNEVLLLRSYLEANGCYCFVQAENHHQLGRQFGPYIQMRIMVPKQDEVRALTLAREFIENTSGDTMRAEDEASLTETALADTTPQNATEDGLLAAGVTPERLALDRRFAIAILFAVFLTFGLGHRYLGQKKQFHALCFAEIVALVSCVWIRDMWAIVFAVILIDVIGCGIYVAKEKRKIGAYAATSR